jgi:FdrA protein
MTYTAYQIRPGAYYDSVTLMQLQKSLLALPGVADAGVMMATPANCELLAASDFDLSAVAAKPDDLLIIIKAETESAAGDALNQIDGLLRARQNFADEGYRPHSLRGALGNFPAAEWVLISTPGRYAAAVADEALDAGRHVFLYSDNVPLEEEIRLKRKARAAGLLVMGPDCGTAILNGVGLGFANRVRRGRVGIVAASGTGLQAASVEIHRLGEGVSQAFGTGGRDLKAEIGGITALQALNWLAQDEGTDVILLISKPPAAEVAAALLRAAQTCGKPVVVDFIGYPPPARRVGNLAFAAGLTDAADLAVQTLNLPISSRITSPQSRPLSGSLRALFSGGTLAYELLLGLRPVLSPLYSNLADKTNRQPGDSTPGHLILDMGEDEFTQGRLHPMMDNDLRLRRLRREAADPATDLILLDVVLGEGAHPDPAAELAPAVAEAVSGGKRVLAVVVGTDEDPQGTDGQTERFAAAGAAVCRSVSAALDYVYALLPPVAYAHPPVSFATESLATVNVGLESFHDSIKAQGGAAVQVDWRPPAGGNEQLMGILDRLKRKSGEIDKPAD